MKASFYIVSLLAAGVVAGCEKPAAPVPVINVVEKAVFLDPDQTEATISYSVSNAGDDAVVSAKSDASWLVVADVEPGSVILSVDPNTGEDSRNATVTLSYSGAADAAVTFRQTGTDSGPVLSFDMRVIETRSRSVVVECVPSDPQATYIAMAVEKADYDMHASEQEVFDTNMDYFIEWGMAFGAASEEEAVRSFLRQGSMTDYEITVSKPETDYYFYAYGMNADGTITSDGITKVEFRTTSPEEEDCTFDFAVRPSYDNIRINVTPSSIYVQYYWNVLPKAEFDAYGGDAQKIIDDVSAGLGEDEHLSDWLVYHNQAANFTGLTPGEEYVVFAFGCDVTGYPTTEIMSETFTAELLDKVDCGFMLSRDNVRATSFAYRIVPEDDEIMWLAYTLPAELLESYAYDIDAMTDDVLDVIYAFGIDWSSENDLVHAGEKTLCSYDMMGGELEPESGHVVVVLPVSRFGTRLGDAMTTTVTTVAAGTPSDMTMDIQIESLEGGATLVTFTPSSKQVFFYDIVPASTYESYNSDEQFMNGMLSYYVNNGLLSYKLSYDRATMEADLESGTEYVAVAFGYDAMISTALFKKEFTPAEAAAVSSLSASSGQTEISGPVLAELLRPSL